MVKGCVPHTFSSFMEPSPILLSEYQLSVSDTGCPKINPQQKNLPVLAGSHITEDSNTLTYQKLSLIRYCHDSGYNREMFNA